MNDNRKGTEMRLENVKKAWNEQADEHNQWNENESNAYYL